MISFGREMYRRRREALVGRSEMEIAKRLEEIKCYYFLFWKHQVNLEAGADLRLARYNLNLYVAETLSNHSSKPIFRPFSSYHHGKPCFTFIYFFYLFTPLVNSSPEEAISCFSGGTKFIAQPKSHICRNREEII